MRPEELRAEQVLAILPVAMQEVQYVKPRLNTAFAALRRKGYLARQNYLCCRSCASYQIALDAQAMSAHRQKRLQGGVYYHQQDAEALKGNITGNLHIRYGQIEYYREDRSVQVWGKDPELIAQDVVQALRGRGLYVEWNGDPARTIQVCGLDQTVIDAAAAVVRLGGDYKAILEDRASGK